jgi:predicted transcriptional regulator YdeE
LYALSIQASEYISFTHEKHTDGSEIAQGWENLKFQITDFRNGQIADFKFKISDGRIRRF